MRSQTLKQLVEARAAGRAAVLAVDLQSGGDQILFPLETRESSPLMDAALIPALASAAFYIGCLGSRKTQLARVNRMKRAGVSDEAIARIHGPVGLRIGAKSPAEIAISILAEMTAVLRGGDAVKAPATAEGKAE